MNYSVCAINDNIIMIVQCIIALLLLATIRLMQQNDLVFDNDKDNVKL